MIVRYKDITSYIKLQIQEYYYDSDDNVDLIAIKFGFLRNIIIQILREVLHEEEYFHMLRSERDISRGFEPAPIGYRRCAICYEIFKDRYYDKSGKYLKASSYCIPCDTVRRKDHLKYSTNATFKKYREYKYNATVQRGYVFDLTFDDFIEFWGKPCHYCNQDIDLIGLDRVDNKIGYVLSNVISCCKTCNSMKGVMSYNDYINQCQRISDHRLQKGVILNGDSQGYEDRQAFR